MFITNAENGNAYAVLAKTDPDAEPTHRGMSCFIVQNRTPASLSVNTSTSWATAESTPASYCFDDCRVGEEDLIGGKEGRGFHQVMGGLESGRINVAARAVGVATAAFEAAISYAQRRETFGVLSRSIKRFS